MRYLRTNTAIRITVGPFLDKTDGITPEVALTATNEHLTLMVDDGNVPTLVLDANATASGGNNDMVHVTNDDAGFYDLELTAANLNYLGRAMLSINYVTDHCPVFHEFMILPAMVYDSLVLGTDVFQVDVTQLLGTAWLTPATAGTPDVNAKLHGGTAQTGRDIGASVLLSSGTGTGQLDFTSGVVKANLVQILGTALTETAGQIAAGFKKVFDVASPVFTAQSVNQTGDSYARIGAPVGASISADIAGVQSDTNDIQTRLPAALVSGRIDASIGAYQSGLTPLQPTTAGRTLDVTATGAAGVDWGNVENPTTAVDLSGTTISTSQAVASVSGAVGSVTGAVGSVTGNVGGNVTGSVGSVATGGITAASIATDAIDADALAADAVTEIQNGLATSANQTTILSKLLKYVQLLARKDAAIATDNATELTAINADGGSGAGAYANTTDSGEAIRDRGDAAWTTATGFSTLDAAGVRSAVGLASANLDTQLGTIDDYLDTEVAAILADTNELQTDWANGGRLDLLIDGIKAKTDNLPASPAATGDIPSAATISDTVWDEALSGHLSAGSTGEALNAAGAAGDPWTTSLPGAYGAGSAGYIIGTNVNATVSSRLASASYTTPPTVTQIRTEIDSNSTQLAAIVDDTGTSGVVVAAASKTGYALSSAGIQAIWDALTSALTTVGSIGKLLVDNINATVGSRSSHSAADVWSVVTRVLTAGTNITLAKGTGVTGFNDLDAAGVRSAVGLASANLDTQLTTIAGYIDTEVAAIKAKTDNLPTDPADQSAVEAAITAATSVLALQTSVDDLEGRLTATRAGYLDNLSAGAVATAASIAALNNVSVSQILTTQMTESYAADGTAPTVAQALMMIQQMLGEFSISGTTLIVKKVDGSTTAATYTLNDNTSPSSLTRAT